MTMLDNQLSLSADNQLLLPEAEDYLRLFYTETEPSDPSHHRLATIQHDIERTGIYWQTYAELTHGARAAWRSSTRCIGRLFWQQLEVWDLRTLTTAADIFAALVSHLHYSTNNGKIRSLISVFAAQVPGQPGIRIWNPQLIRYAGYRQPDGSVIGDPLMVEFTEVVRSLGWQGGAGTPFDLLPLVIQLPGQPPRLFDLPPDAVLEIPLSHPDYPWFADLGLKWHALPAIANMRLEIGGLSYTAAPFSGWYMGTEIGTRNLSDWYRYDMLPVVAEKMGLSTRSDRTLWKDRAIAEINLAVLHSFKAHNVTIVDYHLTSQQFLKHVEREAQAGRATYADWGWIVPPMSGAATPVFHHEFTDVSVKPNFFYQPDPWRAPQPARRCPLC